MRRRDDPARKTAGQELLRLQPGNCVHRDGRIDVRFEDGAVWVGGNAVTCIEGSLIS